MTPRLLRYFLEIVDRGGISKAAAHLQVAQPSVSQGLRQLETELGVALFDRIRRRLVLTPIGAEIVEPAREALRQLDRIEHIAKEAKSLSSGVVHLATLPSLNVDPVPALCARFRKLHPKVSVIAEMSFTSDDCYSKVTRGEADLALALREPRYDGEGLVTTKVGEMEMLLLTPPGSPPSATALAHEQLAQYQFIAGRPGTWTRRYLDELATNWTNLSVAVEATSREMVIPLVVAGVGAAVVAPQFARQGMTHGAVVHHIAPAPILDVVMIRRTDPVAPATKALTRLIETTTSLFTRAGRTLETEAE